MKKKKGDRIIEFLYYDDDLKKICMDDTDKYYY